MVEIIAVFTSPRSAVLAVLVLRAAVGRARMPWTIHQGLGEGHEGTTVLLSGTCWSGFEDRAEDVVTRFGGILLSSSAWTSTSLGLRTLRRR